MRVKREGFIWAAFIFTSINFILGAAVFGLTLFNYQSKKRNFGTRTIQLWRTILLKLIIVSGSLVLVSILTLWATARARKKNCFIAIFIILSHFAFLIASIYLTFGLGRLLEEPAASHEELFRLARHEIAVGVVVSNDSKFVPIWLDNIQKRSTHCCGIYTYLDWNKFWGQNFQGEYPASCCVKTGCKTKEDHIILPDHLSNNIKVEEGCAREINSRINTIILESKKFCSIMTIFIGIATAAVITLYTIVFCFKKSDGNDNNDDDDDDDVSTNVAPSANLPIDNTTFVPKFKPEEISWLNLEYYVYTRKSKVKLPPISQYLSNSPIAAPQNTPPALNNVLSQNIPMAQINSLAQNSSTQDYYLAQNKSLAQNTQPLQNNVSALDQTSSLAQNKLQNGAQMQEKLTDSQPRATQMDYLRADGPIGPTRQFIPEVQFPDKSFGRRVELKKIDDENEEETQSRKERIRALLKKGRHRHRHRNKEFLESNDVPDQTQ